MEICDGVKCTGCGLCEAICPEKAITLVPDEKGFVRPVVGRECLGCGRCAASCPQNNPQRSFRQPTVYAAFARDAQILAASSSGGMFSVLAEEIFRRGGKVFATRLSEGCRFAEFDMVSSMEELARFRGSKYLQSRTGDVYQQVKIALQQDKPVLFIGTPCQVECCKRFLSSSPDNLLTVDILCHGVPSPKVWADYCDLCAMGSSLTDVNFRDKKNGWLAYSLRFQFADGKVTRESHFKDSYFVAFLHNITLRESCYHCSWATPERTGDLSLGDFWGYHSFDYRMRNRDKGISLVLANTSKGKKFFDSVSDRIQFAPRQLQEACGANGALNAPCTKSAVSDAFWQEYLHGKGLASAMQQYCKPHKISRKERMSWFVLNRYYCIPRWILALRSSKKQKEIKTNDYH